MFGCLVGAFVAVATIREAARGVACAVPRDPNRFGNPYSMRTTSTILREGTGGFAHFTSRERHTIGRVHYIRSLVACAVVIRELALVAQRI